MKKTDRVTNENLEIDHETLERDDAVIGRAFRWSLAVIALAAAGGGGAAYWFSTKPAVAVAEKRDVVLPSRRARPRVELPRVHFTDVTSAAGITFVHENGAYGDKLLPETMGGGCAFFDYDNDGDQDLLLVNSCFWPWHRPDDRPDPTTALYQNDGRGQFKDVTAQSGLGITCYGMGAAVGDYDNDGYVDVFISTVGRNRLFHNEKGRFVEVTDEAGVAGEPDGWSTSCGWFDYDNDGDLDLFVCNYIRWTREIDQALRCTLTGNERAYCRPDVFEGAFPYLYRNEGNGKFRDVSRESGIQVRNPHTGVPVAKSLGLAPIDLDDDGWMDCIVANDTVQNMLFHNQRDGTFKEVAKTNGVAFDPQGNARGAMGADAARFRNDRTLGIVIGNFANEQTALYVSQGDALPDEPPQFVDAANATGLGPASQLMLKFGIFFFDYDLDGRLDVFTANGHLEQDIQKVQLSQRYEQPPHLFRNCFGKGGSEFYLVPDENCGEDFAKPLVGRGAAYADIDGDGDLDVLVTAIHSPPRLLRNDQQLGHHWLRVKLRGTHSNRDAIGAWVELEAGGQTQMRQIMPTRSYMSQTELPVTFGLGDVDKIDRLTIRWPDGSKQPVADVAVDRLLEIEQNTAAVDEKAGPKLP